MAMASVAEMTLQTAAEAEANPFLTGIHAPMKSELTIEALDVEGEIPAELNGRYLRIGPNPIDADPARYHWFTGDGMVHGLKLEGGRALWYRNRWVRSTKVSAALGEPPVPSPRGDGSTVNTNVLEIAGSTYALIEAGTAPIRIGEWLETIAYEPFSGTLAAAFSAHPHRDPASGEFHAICYDPMRPDAVRHVVVDRQGSVRRDEPVAVEHGPSIHDCAITSRFAILLDLPVTLSMENAMAGHPFPYRWNPAHRARVGLLPREGKGEEIIWCDVDPCYVFHVCNAFDLPDGRVVLDAVVHDRMFAEGPHGPESTHSAFERWSIDPVARSVERRVIDDHPQEFPRQDERLFGRPYRFAYAMGLASGDGFGGTNHLIKHDLEHGARQIHDFGPDRFPGEFVFVPASPEASEDEGWLIGLVVDMAHETTELAILDARDFDGSPVASVRIPHRVPPGFHGNWLPSV
jgi:carotenoid cleavage dioxygenase